MDLPGIGTVINVISVILGGIIGILFGKLLNEDRRESLTKACGVSVLFIGISGTLEKMISVNTDGTVSIKGGMLIVISLALGAFIGEIINIEGLFERFGGWLKRKTGSGNDEGFIDAFVTASFTVCIGAMAIVGAIEDGIESDPSVLITKSILDFITVAVMACSLGKGSIFSAIPVAVFQGSITALAFIIKPIMTDSALLDLSLVGNTLIFCVGVNLVWGKKIRVANFLPAVIIAVIYSFLPIQL